MKPGLDHQALRGFALLRDPSFASMVRYMQDLKEFYGEQALTGSEMFPIARAQGAVMALKEILDTVESARDLMQKHRV